MKTLATALLILLVVILQGIGSPCAFSSPPRALPSPDSLKYRPLSFNLPQARQKVLSNGIRLYLMEDSELPLVKITLLIKAGQADDPPGKEGLAELTGKVMLTGGVRGMTGAQVDEELALMAADVSCSANLEYSLCTLSVLKKDLDRALDIFSRILQEPAFEEGKLQLARSLKREELRRIADNPDELAFRQYRRLLYRGDPRGRLTTLASLERIERQDISAFHRRFFTPENSILTVSGDVSENDALAELNARLGGWPQGTGRKALPPPAGGQTSSLSLISKDTPQSIILYGHLGPAVSSPDFYPFTVLDFILGSGSFRSRLFQEIRTNRGLAYSTGSIYAGRKNFGIFQAYAFTKADSTARVLTLLREIIGSIRRDGISPEELRGAKNALNNNFIFTFKSADDVAVQQMMLEYQELPPDFLETYRERIDAVKAEDVKRMAVKYLDPEKAIILVVGQEKKFDAPLSTFGSVNREEPF